jgi:hypothetical protein
MKRNFIIFILTVFLTISFMSLTGCIDENLIKEQPSVLRPAQKDDLALQEICRTKCNEYYGKQDLSGHSYKSHYNKKLNKCFLLTEDAGRTSKDLYDIDESQHYGMFFHDLDGIYCNFLETECNSEKEWNSLVAPYMEN